MVVNLFLRTLAMYHQWAYQRLITSISEITDNDYYQDQKLVFKSVHKTLNHLCLGDQLWYARFTNIPCSIHSVDEELYSDRITLQTAVLQQAQHWINFTHNSLSSGYPERLSFKNLKGQAIEVPFYETLTHVFNHGTHHRGQISAIVT